MNPETHEAYLKGMFHLSKATLEGTEKGMAFLQEAVEKDPDDPLAYTQLAYGYITIGLLTRICALKTASSTC